MAHCPACGVAGEPGAQFCGECGQRLTGCTEAANQVEEAAQHTAAADEAAPAPVVLRPVARAGDDYGQKAAATARQIGVQLQSWGQARVGLGLIGLSCLLSFTIFLFIWSGQRGVWGVSIFEALTALVVAGYLAYREFSGKDLLAPRWWGPAAASIYLMAWGVTGPLLRVGSLLFLTGTALLAWTILPDAWRRLAAEGLDWRHALHGYRKVILLGALVAFLALFFTWIPASSTGGWWSGGYSQRYSSYYGGYVSDYDPFKYYNAGFYFPARQGINLGGSVLMQFGLLATLFYAGFVPQREMPNRYRFLPFFGLGYSALFWLAHMAFSWGQLFYLVGAALIGWGTYQLGVKGQEEGPLDLREIPLAQWLARWQ